MCLVIDANVFPSVFNDSSKDHKRFIPILRWITEKRGKIIYGGDKYNRELSGANYSRILVNLNRRGSLVKLPTSTVNKYAAELKRRVPDPDFDDPHIVALIAISRCCVVCSDDKRAYPYFRRKDFYPKGMKPPKIYRNVRHGEKLCCDRHIVAVCR